MDIDRKRLIDSYQKIREDIKNTKEENLISCFKIIKSHFNLPVEVRKIDKEKFLSEIKDIFFSMLENVYTISIEWVEKEYNIKFNERIDYETLEKLTYSDDGKTIDERLEDHYKNTVSRKRNYIDYFYNRIVTIFDNEALYASNHVIHGKLHRKATHVEVLNFNDDICWDHEECEVWLKRGKIPIEELSEIPPYHPVCECYVIYYIEEEEEK